MRQQNSLVTRLLPFGIVTILVLMPFHAFFTAWYASNFGFFNGIRLWKEVILLLLVIMTICIVAKDKALSGKLYHDRLVQVVLIYITFMGLMAAVGLLAGNTNINAAAYGFITDTRLLIFMLVVYAAALKKDIIPGNWHLYILVPALIVVAYGALQLLLPDDFLRHFGYGPDTLPAFQAVDNKPGSLARIQSTMRGPNPLGAYLVATIVLVIGYGTKAKNKLLWGMFLTGAIVVLLGSYSRSAWLGLAVSLAILGFLTFKNKRQRRRLGLLGLAITLVCAAGILIFRDNNTVQNVIFHTDENSLAVTSSNDERASALTRGVKDVYNEPFGRGVGSAGPASVRSKTGARLAENYFIQIGQEAGIAGLALFIAAIWLVLGRLWRSRSDLAARLVLASFTGLLIVNLVSHAFADDTLAYVLGGLIGIALSRRYKPDTN